MNHLSLRQIMLSACMRADFSTPELRKQADAIDMHQLDHLITRMATRAALLLHAYEVMEDGTHPHPIGAFMHATECVSINETPLSDSEFYSLLTVWGKLCDQVQREQPTTSSDHSDARDRVVARFMDWK